MENSTQDMAVTNQPNGSATHSRGWRVKGFFLFLIFISLLGNKGWGQTSITMPNSSTTVAYVSYGYFYDPGGSGSNYSNYHDRTITFYPAVSTMKVQLTFTSFNTESGYDGMMIYNGNSTSASLISSGASAGSNSTTCPAGAWSGSLSGASLPKSSGASNGVVTSTASDGSITISFQSDVNTVASGWAVSISLTGNACGGNFLDFGGGGTDYWNGVYDVVTLYPTTATDKVRLTFTSFTTENNFDGMMIYNGNSTSATLISSGLGVGSNSTTCPAGAWRGSLTGSSLPKGVGESNGVVTSTAADGTLTIVFQSDGGTTAAGWAAAVSCYTPCSAPTLAATTAASSITQCSASTGGDVTADNSCAVTERGVCYKTSTGPTTSDTKVTASGTTGSFASSLTGLSPGTTYYVRSYATNSSGTSYGAEINFTTSAAATTYYSASAGNLELTSSWGTNTNGTGCNPPNFTANNTTYIITNRSTATIGAAWTVSGTSSKVQVGQSSATAVTFTIPSTYAFTGTIDVATASSGTNTLDIQNSTLPTLGTLSTGSTVKYSAAADVTLPAATFYNLTLSNTGVVSKKRTLSAATTVTGNVVIEAYADLDVSATNYGLTVGGDFVRQANSTFTARSGTVTFNGSSTQRVHVTTEGGTTPCDADVTFYNLTINGSDVKIYYNKTNDRKVNINDLTVSSSKLLNFISQ